MKNLPLSGLFPNLLPALVAILVLASCSKKNEPEQDMEDVETVESTAPGSSESEMTPPAEPETVDSLETESMEDGAASQTDKTRFTETSADSQSSAKVKTGTATTSPKKATSPSSTASTAVSDTAYLRLLSSPPYAQVWMDGKAVGETPMTEYLAVKSGSHELSLQHRNHPQKDTVISLARGDSLKLKIKLEEKVAGGTEE